MSATSPCTGRALFRKKNFIELKTGLAQAVAARKIAAKALNDTRLYTPISGIVGSKFVEIGQRMSAQTPVFTLVKTDVIYARVSVPESEIDQVIMGKNAQVTVSALENRTFNGTVSMIGAVADERTRTYPVKIELRNPDFILRTGMIVRTVIQTDKRVDMLAIPGVAIVRDVDHLTYVFTGDAKSGAAQRKRVLTGRAFQDKIIIRSRADFENRTG